MIKRELQEHLLKDAEKVLVLAILGPRQSGKTTLAKSTFSNHNYVTLEDLDNREFAIRDPRLFLETKSNSHGLILDEIQHAPLLLSYIQTIVDNQKRPGYYVLTGSQNFLVMESISQTLAGRISIHTLLPLSVSELAQANMLPENAQEAIFKGFYPSIYSQDFNPTQWYEDYIRTYVERDVRTVLRVSNLNSFQRFIRLCAGRIGQILNLVSLANDCGISNNTAKAWISILQASYIIYLVEPHFQNFSKRLIKSPKLYFYDTGLACTLLSIDTIEQLNTHYLFGGLFENLVISDLQKNFYNIDKSPKIYFWRDKTGHEVDCIIEKNAKIYPIEIKAGKTINWDFFNGLNYWNNLAQASPENSYLIYAGQENQKRANGNVLAWKNIKKLFNNI